MVNCGIGKKMAITELEVTKAIVENDMDAFRGMVEQDEKIGNVTVLHLASRLGNAEMVSLVLELRPDMVSAENSDNSETPLHEACRMGHEEVVRLLMEKDKWVASKLNCANQSALSLACSSGHLKIVDFLLDYPWLLNIIGDVACRNVCLNVAVSNGRKDIVRELLKKFPELANMTDITGSFPLHYACKNDHAEIAAMLLASLRKDREQVSQFNNNGYTPLHLAAMNGSVNVLEEFSTSFFKIQSKQGENVYHLTMEHDQLEAFKYVDVVLKDTDLIYQLDASGKTIRHLAQRRLQFKEYLETRIPKYQRKRDLTLHTEALQNARNTVTLVNILIATVTFAAVAAKEYEVGGAVGWRIPAANESELYNVWASRRRFHIGDSLRFRYTDSVVIVEKYGFFHCDASQPIVYYNTGDTVVNLDKLGVFYFISGSEQRCNKGQKMIVNVTGARYHPPTIASAPNYDPYHDAMAPAPTLGSGPSTSLDTGLAVSVSASIMACVVALVGVGLCLVQP